MFLHYPTTLHPLFLFALLSGALLLGCTPLSGTQEAPDVIILHLNDVYEIAPLEGGKVGGLARVASLKKQLELEAPVVAVLSGDFLSPSLLGTLTYEGERINGLHMVEVLNALELDYVTFGNHEFDLDEEALLARINDSDFTWISTNVEHVVEGDTVPFTQKGQPLPRSVVQAVPGPEDTLRLLWIGECLPYNEEDYVAYHAYTPTARAEVEKHREGYDVAVALTHFNWPEDSAFAMNNPDFRLLLGGHNHQSGYLPVGGAAIAKADANAKTVYVHRLWFDEATQSADVHSELMPITSALQEDSAVAAVVNKWTSLGNRILNEQGFDPQRVLLETTETLDGREASVRHRPTTLGQAAGNAMLWADSTLDVALLNSGSIRLDDQLTGTITQYDILRTFPFGGGIQRTQMTGAELLEVLRIGLEKNVGTGGYLQGAPLALGKTDEAYALSQGPILPERVYTVGITDYLASGREANLEVLGSYTYETPESFRKGTVNNEIRHIVSAYLSK